MAPTENDKAWQRYIEAKEIQFDQSTYLVDATELKNLSGREPRLMAKFDTPEQLPAPLHDAGYTVLPIRNGQYLLVPGSLFVEVPQCTTLNSIEPTLPFPLYTAGRGSSEAQYIDQAYNVGILRDFLGIDELYQTIRGREYTSRFEFQFSGSLITVESVQIEVDSGYEGFREVVLLEAKIGLPRHINIRQLYYPFRHFSNLVEPRKRVRNIFLAYDIASTQYSLYEFVFTDKLNPASAEVVRCALYRLEAPRDLTIHDLMDIRFQTKNSIAPQADDLNKVFELLVVVEAGFNRAQEVADYFVFDQRQSNYYREAAEYLGLIQHSRDQGYLLTELGILLLSIPPQEKPEIFAKLIVNSWIFVELVERAQKRRNFTFNDIDDVIGGVRTLSGESRYSGSTVPRRRRTILSWVEWLVDEIGCFSLQGDRILLR
ncbi:MAG: hypothetical protein IPK19_39345 [Chloroflexi bacterium]|nr:hypothetical protein [Chloroflexota bacterium]